MQNASKKELLKKSSEVYLEHNRASAMKLFCEIKAPL